MNELKDMAAEFLKGVQPGVKEQAAFEDFLRAVGVKVRNEFREAWLAKINEGAKPKTSGDDYRILPESLES